MGGSFHKWRVFLLVSISIFMSTLDSSIVNLVLPYIMQDMSTSITMGQWVILSYLLAITSLLLIFGRLADIFGRKPVYLAGFSFFTLGSFGAGMAGSPLILIAFRAIQGSGAAMLMACSQALVVDSFQEGERGKALGLLGAVVASGLIVGPVLGGLILEIGSWRMIFYINLPIGILAIILGLFWLKRDQHKSGESLGKISSILMISLICFFIRGC